MQARRRSSAPPIVAPLRAPLRAPSCYRRGGRLLRTAFAAGILALGACRGISLDPTPPPGYDLSGTWRLVESASEPAPSPQNLRAQGSMLAFITQDFPVLRATELRIEQSRDSMGVRFDGTGYRDVSWGTRTRGLWEVQAGWNEGDLLILSKAKDAKARETLSLSADGRTLSVDVRVGSRGDDLAIRRVFRRL